MTRPPRAILPQLPSHGKLARALWLVALGGLLLYVAFTVHLAMLGLGYPYQLDYGEGLVLFQARQLASGESIYKHLDSYPYIFSNYPPLFQAAVAPLLAVVGVAFWPGRLLVLAATLGLACILYALARRGGTGRLAATLAGLLFLGSPYIYHWAPLMRIDLPALFLSTLALLVLTRPTVHTGMTTPASQRSLLIPGWRGAGTAALLFVLALYTKQSYVAAPAAAAVYLALHDRVALRRFLLVALLAGALPFIALEMATGGAFSFGLFTANVNPFSLALLCDQLGSFLRTFAVLVLLSLVAFACIWPRLHWRAALVRLPLPGWYAAFALATVALAGKVGAWENYFFEALFVLCLGSALGLDALLRSPRRAVQMLAPLAVIVQLALMWHDPRIGWRVIREDGAANRTLAPLIAAQSGMVLSEDLGLLLVNGKDIPYFSFEYAQLARVGRWDQHWELENLRAARFALVVLEKGTREDPDRYQRFTREVLSAIDSAYGLARAVGKYRIYAPRPLLRQTNLRFGDSISLLGVRVDSPPFDALDAVAGLPRLDPAPGTLRITLLWQAERAVARDLTVFVHLEDDAGERRAQDDAMPLFGLYPTSRWAAGEIVRDYHDIALPAGLPAGRYTVRVGLYDAATHQRLTLADGRDSAVVLSLPLGLTPPPALPDPRDRFSNGIALAGYAVSSPTLRAGAALTVTLHWQTERYVDESYAVFVHLAQRDGRPLAQADGAPLDGAYPSALWNPAERITDVHVLQPAAPLSPGAYRLLAGLYNPTTGERLLLTSGQDSIELGRITVP